MTELRRASQDPLRTRFKVDSIFGPQNSDRTKRTLRKYNLEGSESASVCRLTAILAQLEISPNADLLSSFVEEAWLEGLKQELSNPSLAAEIYTAAAIHAYYYLFDAKYEDQRELYDSHVRDVCILYNASVKKLMELLMDEDRKLWLKPDQEFYIQTNNHSWNVRCELVSGNWVSDEIKYFRFANDYEIINIENEYRQEGLGVPLIASRQEGVTDKKEEIYYPKGLCFPVSAFLRPNFAKQSEEEPDAILELYDPLVSPFTLVNGRRIPLESDLTTPLAYFMSDPKKYAIGTMALLRPEEFLKTQSSAGGRSFKGLYMMQPYEQGKIPIILVHGLWSSPITWLEMYNSLRSIKEIRDNYQFWFYFYPSGQPFWISASQLRDDLREIRYVIDTEHKDPALDEMVLVGHSMGGLISRLQVMNSENNFWNLISDAPFEEVKLNECTKDELRKWFFFDANPSIRRVITIATPFNGSEAANDVTKWLAARAISLPGKFSSVIEDFLSTQDSLIKDHTLLNIETSIDSLAPDCPFLKAMDKCYISRNVALNNINGRLNKGDRRWYLPNNGDGVVNWYSSHRTDVESEKTVSAIHMVIHAHPAVILETHRILVEHLYQMQVEHKAKTTFIARENDDTKKR